MVTSKVNEALGIALEDSCLDVPPSIIVYGAPSTGKTSLVAQSFQNLLWIVSEPDSIRFYESTLRDKPSLKDDGFKMPDFKYIPEYQPDGKTRFKNRDTLKAIMERICETSAQGKFEYDGLVIDQYNTFAARVYEEIKSDPAFGGNAFRKVDALKSWNAWMCQIPRLTKRVMVLICHEASPKYDEDENSPTRGSLVYKGGPAFPIGPEREAMAAMSTICVRIVVEGSAGHTKRAILTEANAQWTMKFRDAQVKAKEEHDLRKLLLKSGYRM